MQQSFDKVLDWKLVLPLATFLLSNGNSIIALTFAANYVQDWEVACDNHTSWMLKSGHQTFITPSLTDNHSIISS